MENRKERVRPHGKVVRARAGFPIFYFLLSIFSLSVLCALSSCGTPGDPQPPRPPIPVAITDLSARQQGEAVVLTFTLPAQTTEGDPLAAPPDVEIFRGFLAAGAAAKAGASLALVYTIPSAVADTYIAEGRLRFADPLQPADLARYASERLVYFVRTRASKRAASADSNRVALHVYPVPEKISDLAATVTEPGVELRWSRPSRTTSSTPISALGGFRIYRAEVEPPAIAEAVADPSKAKLKTPLEILGVSPSASYRDTQFEFDRTYLYVVRSVAQYELDSVESADSNTLLLTPRDTFPPAPPENLVVVLVPATPETPAHFELSWGISQEPDVAGYHVYRSEQPGQRGTRLNRELLPTPTFRDMSIAEGRGYNYTVTVVDRAGNESAPSASVSASVPISGVAEKEKP